MHCRISDIDRLPVGTLEAWTLASSFGGPIATQRREQELVPMQATFRVRLDGCNRMASPAQELSGVARLQGGQPSLLQRAWTHVLAVLRSEASM